jgi:hypothetical protein
MNRGSAGCAATPELDWAQVLQLGRIFGGEMWVYASNPAQARLAWYVGPPIWEERPAFWR